MKKKLTVEISEGLGNQIFMYAFAFSISKKFNYNLFIDNRSGYSRKKNLLRPHQVYMLDSFNIDQNIADNQMIFDTSFKRIQKKLKHRIINIVLRLRVYYYQCENCYKTQLVILTKR